MEREITTTEQPSDGPRVFAVHHARTAWMLLGAVVAVVAGFSMLNMVLAESGMEVLHAHTAPIANYVTRLIRQG